MMSKALRIFVLFSCGYFISYVYRGINIEFAPFMAHDIGLSAADLGLLTSLYFLGFAGAQLPAGVLLDHFGVRRVCALLLLVAAAGAAVFGMAHGLATLMAGRLLIGVGVSVCLGGAFKALAQWFPVNRLPLLNGLVMAVGGFGGVVVGSPLNWLLRFTDWRMICFGLTAVTVATSAAIWFGAPDAANTHRQAGLVEQLRGVGHVLRSRVFWKIASFAGMAQGVFYAMQSLWMAPYMRDVMGLSEHATATLVSVVALAMMAGCVGFGAVARRLEQYGMSLSAFSGAGMLLFICVQGAIMAHVPIPAAWLWAAYGIFGGSGILSYAVLAEHFPAHLMGRVNTSLTLVIFVLIFLCQTGVGTILSAYPAQAAADGAHYPVEAHMSAWTVLGVLQVMAAVWYFWPTGRRVAKPVRMPEAG
ncbi:MAG: MFS transporter [Paraburkholderia sp.]|uniref:MFS transporter n=1 Tax=Burkholderiaceae TaxID=119060 RepID=UPI0010F51FB0|nr:MFS transporter [Burkholderia sp. 4M9327F10]